MSKINIDWKWLAGLVVAIFACIGTYWGVVQNNSPRPYPPVTIAFPYPTSAPSRATEVPRSFGPTPTTSFVAAVTTIAPSPTSEILTCSIQVGQLFANAWANAQVRSSLKCPINAQHSIDSAVEANRCKTHIHVEEHPVFERGNAEQSFGLYVSFAPTGRSLRARIHVMAKGYG